VGHLDELYAKYKDKGLVVLAVTNEGRGLVDKFVGDTKATHPIVIEDGDSAGAFGIGGFPSSFLIDADGKIAWSGHPASIQEAEIERLLQDVRLVPELPRKFAAVQKSMEKGDYAGARKSLDGQLAGTTLSDEERKAAEEAVKWIDDRGAGLLSSAEADGKRGDWFAASETLNRVIDSFKGLEPAAKAKETLDGILKDKDRKREVEAGEVYEKTRTKAKALKPEQAAQMMRAVAKKYEGTKAAEKATAEAVKLEAASKK
jgi:hypothetical protein